MRNGKARRYKHFDNRVHHPALKRMCLSRLREYADLRMDKAALKKRYIAVGKDLIKRRCLAALSGQVDLNRRGKFMSLRREKRIKFGCMAALHWYSVVQMKQKVFLEKHILTRKATVLDGIARYAHYRRYFKAKKGEAAVLHVRSVAAEYFRKLKIWRATMQGDREKTEALRVLKVKQFLEAWMNCYREIDSERAAREKAQDLNLRHLFDRLRRGCQATKGNQRMRNSLKKRQRQFYVFNSKRRALSELYKHMNGTQINRLRKQYAREVLLKRIFFAWRGTLPLLKRERILLDSADLMWKNLTMEKCFYQLKAYTENKLRSTNIIEQFQERAELTLKAEVMLALHSNIQQNQQRRLQFFAKVRFVPKKRLEDPFQRWLEYAEEHRMVCKADLFFR